MRGSIVGGFVAWGNNGVYGRATSAVSHRIFAAIPQVAAVTFELLAPGQFVFGVIPGGFEQMLVERQGGWTPTQT
jgi:hypothetical protein